MRGKRRIRLKNDFVQTRSTMFDKGENLANGTVGKFVAYHDKTRCQRN